MTNSQDISIKLQIKGLICRDGAPGKSSKVIFSIKADLQCGRSMTRQQIASMNVHPVDNPRNSLITISDLKEAARSCGFTSDPYSTPIIDITNMTLGRIIFPDLPEVLEQSEELPTYSEVLEHSNKWNTHPPTYENVMQDHENK